MLEGELWRGKEREIGEEEGPNVVEKEREGGGEEGPNEVEKEGRRRRGRPK